MYLYCWKDSTFYCKSAGHFCFKSDSNVVLYLTTNFACCNCNFIPAVCDTYHSSLYDEQHWIVLSVCCNCALAFILCICAVWRETTKLTTQYWGVDFVVSHQTTQYSCISVRKKNESNSLPIHLYFHFHLLFERGLLIIWSVNNKGITFGGLLIRVFDI